jgi:RNA polymerase-binding transcription factor DksA
MKKKLEAQKKIEAKKKADAKRKLEAQKKVEAKKKADAKKAADALRKKQIREREIAKKALAAAKKKELAEKAKAKAIADKEKAKEKIRLAAEKQAQREAAEKQKIAEREAKEAARLLALAEKEAAREAALRAKRKPEPPPRPAIIKTEFQDGVQATKEFDLKFLISQREAMLEKRSLLTKQAVRLEDEANAMIEDVEMGDVQFDEEGGEGDTMVVERERDLMLSAQARQEVEEIDAALARIESGEYGYSIHSGLPIPRERLKAIPWTTESVLERVGGIGRR